MQFVVAGQGLNDLEIMLLREIGMQIEQRRNRCGAG